MLPAAQNTRNRIRETTPERNVTLPGISDTPNEKAHLPPPDSDGGAQKGQSK
jgi:hypothetical protein